MYHDPLTACTPNQPAAIPIKGLTGASGTAHNYCYSTTRNTHTKTLTCALSHTDMKLNTQTHARTHTHYSPCMCCMAISCSGLCIKKGGKRASVRLRSVSIAGGEQGRERETEGESKTQLLTGWLKRNQKRQTVQVKASVTVCHSAAKANLRSAD